MMIDPTEGFTSSSAVTKKTTRNTIQQQQQQQHILYSSITSDGDEQQLYTSSSSSFLEKTPQATPYLTNQRLYERISDQILDIVLTPITEFDDEQFIRMISDSDKSTSSPLSKKQIQQLKKQYQELQVSLIEQLSKIMTANGKTLWSQARMRSGVLPSGRTVLGTIIDPFNLFTEPSKQQVSMIKRYNNKKTSSNSIINEEDRSVTLTRQLISLLHQHATSDDDDSTTTTNNENWFID